MRTALFFGRLCWDVSAKSSKKSDVRGSDARPVVLCVGRDSSISRAFSTYLGAKGRDFAPRDSVVDCVEISSRRDDQFRWFADPPTRQVIRGRGKIQRHSARSAEIQRNRRLLGLKGRNFERRGYAGDRGEISSANRRKPRWLAAPPTGRFSGGGARFGASALSVVRRAFSGGSSV